MQKTSSGGKFRMILFINVVALLVIYIYIYKFIVFKNVWKDSKKTFIYFLQKKFLEKHMYANL